MRMVNIFFNMEKNVVNFFEDEFQKLLPNNKLFLTIIEINQIRLYDENNEARINFNHLRNI